MKKPWWLETLEIFAWTATGMGILLLVTGLVAQDLYLTSTGLLMVWLFGAVGAVTTKKVREFDE